METGTLDRIQLIREAAERLKKQNLEVRTEQPLPFESRESKDQRKKARQTIQPNQEVYIGKNGVRSTRRTYGNYSTIQLLQETHGMTAIEGETPGYRHDY